MDEYIARVANQARVVARMRLQWELDRLGLICGTVVPIEDDYTGGQARMIPSHTDQYGQGWCLLVRDA